MVLRNCGVMQNCSLIKAHKAIQAAFINHNTFFIDKEK